MIIRSIHGTYVPLMQAESPILAWQVELESGLQKISGKNALSFGGGHTFAAVRVWGSYLCMCVTVCVWPACLPDILEVVVACARWGEQYVYALLDFQFISFAVAQIWSAR